MARLSIQIGSPNIQVRLPLPVIIWMSLVHPPFGRHSWVTFRTESLLKYLLLLAGPDSRAYLKETLTHNHEYISPHRRIDTP